MHALSEIDTINRNNFNTQENLTVKLRMKTSFSEAMDDWFGNIRDQGLKSAICKKSSVHLKRNSANLAWRLKS